MIELIPEIRNTTVLLADYNDAIRQMLRHVLERSSFNVIEAKSGEDAVRMISGSKQDVSFFLADILIPKKGGLEAYQEIKAIKPDIKALFMSSHAYNIWSLDMPYDRDFIVITKPFLPSDLIKKLNILSCNNSQNSD